MISNNKAGSMRLKLKHVVRDECRRMWT